MKKTSFSTLGTQALKVGVMGGTGEGIAAEHLRLAEELGAAVARPSASDG